MNRLAQGIAFGLATASLVFAAGCGSSQPPVGGQMGGSPSSPPPGQLPPGPVNCPAAGSLAAAGEIVPALLPTEQTLRAWQTDMVGLGPRFTGSPAHHQFHEFLVQNLMRNGLEIRRDPIKLEWWHHKQYSLKLIENGVETAYPVASYYPYSGSTPVGGIVAELADAGTGLEPQFQAGEFTGKIAFYEENQLPLTAALFYSTATYVHDPDFTLTPATSYKRASVSFLTPQELTSQGSAMRAGAAGAIVSYEASFANAEGQYTPFLTSPAGSAGVPTIYVDRATGNQIKARLKPGVKARLELVVDKFPNGTTEDIIATLPGQSRDEVIIVNTHTDGTSAAQENGNFGLLSLAQYFSALPLECRPRTMVFAFTPGHFHSGIGGDTERLISRYPDIIAKAVGSITLEHLGQMEWVDDATGFHPTGLVEPGAFYGSQIVSTQTLMKNAVIAEDLRRTFVVRPIGVIYFGLGSGLNARGVPNTAFISGPNSMLAFGNNQHLDKVNYTRMAAEIRAATRIAADLQSLPKAQLCAGMPPSQTGPTGCVPLP